MEKTQHQTPTFMKLRILFAFLLSAFTAVGVSAQSLNVTHIEPLHGTSGSTITIIGNGFNPSTSTNKVTFLSTNDGVDTEATILSASENRLTLTVPSGIKGGNYKLKLLRTNDNVTTTGFDLFSVTTIGGYLGVNGSTKKTVVSGGEYSNFQSVDLNSDGYLDFVYADSNKVMWAKSDGESNVSFTQHEIASISNSYIVRTADIDLDGYMDVVVTQMNLDSVSNIESKLFWYENKAPITGFIEHQIADFGGSTINLNFIKQLELADVDSDGDKDIVLMLGGDRDVVMYRNNSAFPSHFSSKQLLKSFPSIVLNELRVGDMNNDGNVDIVVSTENEVGWFKNSSDTTAFVYSVINDNELYNSNGLHLSDIDNDGDLDIFAKAGLNNIYRLENDGTSDPNFTISTIDSGSLSSLTSGDIDNDGDTDLIFRGLSKDVSILENDGAASPSFTKRVAKGIENDLASFSLADVDNDGGLDLIGLTYSSIDYYKNIDRPTQLGHSVSFDGHGDYISIPDNDSLDLTDIFTIEFWINSETTANKVILEKGIGNKSYHFQSSNSSSTGGGRKLLFGISNNSNGRIVSQTDVFDGNWHHIAATFNNTSSLMQIYVDGKLDASKSSVTLQPTPNSSPIHIGSRGGTVASAITGKMDEVRFWNDERTKEEIQSNMFQNLVGDESNLLAYYSFDGNAVTATDFSTNNFEGALAGDVTRNNENHPYGTIITGNEGWRMFSSPINGMSYGELLDTLWTQGFTGADSEEGTPNVLIWDETTQSFGSISNADDIPDIGQGFMVYTYDDDDYDGTGDGFPKILTTKNAQNVGLIFSSLEFTNSDTLANDGWNLLGNPYGTTIDWDYIFRFSASYLDDAIYVWSDSTDSGNGDYLTWNGSTGTLKNGKIASWQGFWVKAFRANPELLFTNGARTSGGIFLKKKSVPTLSLTLNGNGRRSTTMVSLQPEASITKDRSDAYKLKSLNTDNFLALFTQLEDGFGLDINALPSDLDKLIEIPVGFDGTDLNGDFELNWELENIPADWNFVLVDNITNEEVYLKSESSYSFELTQKVAKKIKTQNHTSPQHGVISPKVIKAKSQDASRFTLRIAPPGVSVSNETLVDLPIKVELQQNYPNPFNPSTTIAYGIPKTGKVTLEVFDLLGRKVATLLNQNKTAGRHTINFDARSFSSGMYIYRLQAGNSVITKKLTLIK